MINVTANAEEKIIASMAKMLEITRLHTTNGRWDHAAEIQTATLEAFDNAISRLRKIPGIKDTDTSLLLSSRIS